MLSDFFIEEPGKSTLYVPFHNFEDLTAIKALCYANGPFVFEGTFLRDGKRYAAISTDPANGQILKALLGYQ